MGNFRGIPGNHGAHAHPRLLRAFGPKSIGAREPSGVHGQGHGGRGVAELGAHVGDGGAQGERVGGVRVPQVIQAVTVGDLRLRAHASEPLADGLDRQRRACRSGEDPGTQRATGGLGLPLAPRLPPDERRRQAWRHLDVARCSGLRPLDLAAQGDRALDVKGLRPGVEVLPLER